MAQAQHAKFARRPLLRRTAALGLWTGLGPPLTALANVPAIEPQLSWQQVLDRARREAGLVGVSASVVRSHSTLFVGGSGQADLETHRAMTADTVLYAGSLSKIFTAMLTLLLRDNDALDLAAPLRNFRDRGHPTFSLEHLLTHTSGLERESPSNYWYTGQFPDDVALRKFVATAKLRSTPGTRWHYSNMGYAMVGQALAQSAQKPFHDVLHDHILVPLGLTKTSADGEPALVDLAMGYSPQDALLPTTEQPFAGVGRRIGTRHERLYHHARAMTPAFGIYSCARDLGKLGQTLLGHADDRRVLSDRSRRALFEPKVPVNLSGTKHWSLGLKLTRKKNRLTVRHEGWFAAHKSHLLIDPQLKVAVAVMANSDDAQPAQLADALMTHAQRVLDVTIR